MSNTDSGDRSGTPLGHADRWLGVDLCRPFVELLPVTGASVSVIGRRNRRVALCSSDTLAARLDSLQFELGEGPQWVAMKTGQPCLCSEISGSQTAEWPVFAAAASRQGVGALFAFPITMGFGTVGVVDLYRTSGGVLNRSAIALASRLAREVSGPAVRAAINSAEQEHDSISAGSPTMRREVHQATGMILMQLETTATEAFSLLRAHAFVTGRAVEDVASDVVNRIIDFRHLAY